MDEMFRQSKLTSEHKFLDIGCGIGSVVLQAAAWAGCQAAVSGGSRGCYTPRLISHVRSPQHVLGGVLTCSDLVSSCDSFKADKNFFGVDIVPSLDFINALPFHSLLRLEVSRTSPVEIRKHVAFRVCIHRLFPQNAIVRIRRS